MADPVTSAPLTIGVRALAAVATGVLLGLGLGVLIADGRWWPLVSLVPLSAALLLATTALATPSDRPRVARIVALSYALHVAVTVLLYTGSVAVGRGGFIPGDDSAYADVAANFIRFLKGDELVPGAGPPYWGGNAYLFGTWVYLESTIFYLIGPEVLVPVLLNGVFALVAGLFVFDTTRMLFSRRSAFVALLLAAFYPSLVLWSSLNLKDALALFLSALCLWSIARFQRRPSLLALTVAVATLVPMHSLRPYLFFGLTLLVPLTTGLTPFLDRAARARWTAIAAVSSALLLLAMQVGVDASPQMLVSLEEQRRAMGVGARTRFVEMPPLAVEEGDTFVVPTTVSTPSTPARIVHVPPNSRVIVETGTPAPAPANAEVVVRPGDIVVVGPPEVTPRPIEQRTVLTSPQVEQGMTLARADPPLSEVALRSLSYLPTGLAFSLFGPFPWLLERQVDRLLLPEIILWYVCLAATAATLWHERERWQVLAPLALFVSGLLLLFALVEGNWATLLRHRAMTVPWVLALAAPSLIRLAAIRAPRGSSQRPL